MSAVVNDSKTNADVCILFVKYHRDSNISCLILALIWSILGLGMEKIQQSNNDNDQYFVNGE